MGKIKILDEITANKIAAGEVVDRPASVVKELVENSLDAGSTRIEVRVSGAGLDTITVTDNGAGMSEEDAGLAFSRHATSKISGEKDLDAIATLGFRGEALPSIAAVAKVEMKTRVHDSVVGTYIRLENGIILEKAETGCPAGTSFTVSGLFKNIPARRKNIKSTAIEIGHISDVINRLAIAYPEVGFSLFHEQKALLRTTGHGDLLPMIATIYGTETARSMIPVSGEESGITVTGFIGKPSLSRSGRNHQFFVVNRRVVRNRQISQALEHAYHSLMMVSRHPVAFLNLKIPYNLVDPNVHPSKSEVRLFILDKIVSLTEKVVREALYTNNLIPQTRFERSETNDSVGETESFVQQSLKDISQTDKAVIEECIIEKSIIEKTNGEKPAFKAEITVEQGMDRVKERNDGEYWHGNQKSGEVQEIENGESLAKSYPWLRPLCQVDNTYIVARGEDGGFYLIDQHAAHERILYERNMKSAGEEYTQMLAIPVHLDLSHLEAQVLIENILEFSRVGFIIEHFGGDSFLLRGVPQGFPAGTEKKIFLDLLDYFYQNLHKLANKQLHESLLIMMSCRAAIKAGDRLTQGQMEQLLADLGKTDLPFTCPHGRPTTIHISSYELEKMFKRVT